jgi:hypothetical protein
MRTIEIDLAQPFEEICATVLALPTGSSDAVTDRLTNKAELKRVIRGLHEAANGRQVETKIGLVAIAPPAFEFLKARPFRVGTQTDLLIEAAARLIGGLISADLRDEITGAVVDDKSGYKASIHYRPSHRPPVPLMLEAGSPL